MNDATAFRSARFPSARIKPDAAPLISRNALAVAIALAFPVAALAAPAPDLDDARELDRVDVEGQRVQAPSSPKYTQPLVDTPQTINVVPQEVIEEQGALSLTDALRNIPGITLQVGEGGAGSGDFLRIRGFDASNDVSIDGFSDSLQYTRNDLFNVEALEVTKGPNSTVGGAGNAAGTINTVSKTPRLDDFVRGTIAVGTNDLGRLTADVNRQLSPGSAFRLNVMSHDQDVADRDEIFRERWGIAPSVAFGLDGDTQVTLSYFHQTEDNLIDYGIPFLIDGSERPIDRSNYYGVANYDTEEQDIDIGTVSVEHAFSDRVTLINRTRMAEVDRYAIWSTPQNRGATGPEDAPCYPCTFENAVQAILEGRYEDALFQTAGPQGIGRDATSRLIANHTMLDVDIDSGNVHHDLVTGIEISREDYQRDGLSVSGLQRLVNLYDPDPVFTGPVEFIRRPNQADNRIDSLAAYVFDTMAIGDAWLLSGGVRWERFEADTLATNNSGVVTTTDQSDSLWSGQLGVTYKPAENGSVYASWGNAKEPPAISAAGTGAAGTDGGERQESENLELGTKWELFDRRLLATAALFRAERSNELIDDDGVADTPQVFEGERRVQGVELSASGNITEQWYVLAAYTYMDTEITRASAGSPAQGAQIAYAPEHSLSLWTTYDLNDVLGFGFGAQYVGERGTSDTTDFELDDYWLLSAMASWRVHEQINLRLNVNNLTDELYYERPRFTGSYAFAVPGEGRNAMLSLEYSF